ncbi:hypothetical protein D9M71_734210 [compost metagenome]
METAGTVITRGSARRSAQSIEYGVSLFGVMTAVSAGVATRCSLDSWLKGALNWLDLESTANSFITA